MVNCRYDKAAEDYLRPDGEPCKVDDYGDPTTHCTSRRTCSQHVGMDEITCPRCIRPIRRALREIPNLGALMLPEALSAGVESQAAMLAGPAANPEAWSWRKVAARQGGSWHLSLIEDDDERHPYSVLTRWQMMLSEDWGHDLPEQLSIAGAAAYLERNLSRLANDPEQDWPLFASEVRKVFSHMETVLHNDTRPERGAPCPECRKAGKWVRMVRKYAHWCEDEECARQFHFNDDSADVWVCPADKAHWFTAEAYAEWVKERKGA